MSKKLLDAFGGKLVQVSAEELLVSMILLDADKEYLYFGDDTGIKLCVPKARDPILALPEVELVGDLNEMMKEMIEESKKKPH